MNVAFSVAAVGVPTLTYPWLKNGTSIVGATNANYVISNVAANAAANYSCLVSNAFGKSTSSNATLTVLVPDTTIPIVSITSPTSGQRWSNDVFTVAGKVADNGSVSNVFYRLNGSDWTNATSSNGWTNWTAIVTLMPGTNTVIAYAVDEAGNRSATNSQKVVYVVSAPLGLNLVALTSRTSVGASMRKRSTRSTPPAASSRRVSLTSIRTTTARSRGTRCSNHRPCMASRRS